MLILDLFRIITEIGYFVVIAEFLRLNFCYHELVEILFWFVGTRTKVRGNRLRLRLPRVCTF